MASAPTLPFVSPEEYLRTSYEPECEYVDGVLIPKEMPKNKHSLLQYLLLMHLATAEERLDLSIRPELRVRTGATRFRVPDVCVYEGVRNEDVPGHPPLLTIEVVSDTEPMSALKAKLRDHLAMGAKLAVMVDPHDRSVLIQDGAGLRSIEPNVIRIQAKQGVLEIDFDALFNEMDRRLGQPQT